MELSARVFAMTLLAGRYRVQRELGRGAMGVVFLAYDERLDRPVALKELLLQGHFTPELRRELAGRFDREARAAGRLNHPNIVSVYDVFADDEHSYIVMEYVEGETLDSVLARGPLDAESASAVAVQVLHAVDHAHANEVIHRDLKPENVFLQPNGLVKVADFGIAHIGDASVSWTRAGTIVGTVGYMSPEQLRGESVDQRTDVFAVGVLLFEMLTGINPFGSDTQTAVMYRIAHEEPPPVRSVRTGAPKYLDAVIRKALHKDRDQRYQSAAAMASDVVNRKAPKVRPATLVPPPRVTQASMQAFEAAATAGRSLPTVIGMATAADPAPADTPPTPSDSAAYQEAPPVEGSAAPPAAWPSADAVAASPEATTQRRGSAWQRSGIAAAIIAVVITAAIVGGLLLFSTNGGSVAGGPGTSGAASGLAVNEARVISSLQARLAQAAADYRGAVAKVQSADRQNRTAVGAWLGDLKTYKEKVRTRKAIVAANNKERAKATGPTYRTVTTTNGYTGHVSVSTVQTSAGYQPKLKTEPPQPTKPHPPQLKLATARKQLEKARTELRDLQVAFAATSVGPQFAPLLTQIGDSTTQLMDAVGVVRGALSTGVSTRTRDGQNYSVLDPASVKSIADGASFVLQAKTIRQSLLGVLRGSGLAASDLRAGPSASPSASGSPLP